MSDNQNNQLICDQLARLDTALTSLTGTLGELSTLLARYTAKLDALEKVADKTADLLEKRRIETDLAIEKLYRSISDTEEDMEKKLKENQEQIVKKIDNLQPDVDKRMGRVERIMWIALGGGAVISFILPYVNFSAIFN